MPSPARPTLRRSPRLSASIVTTCRAASPVVAKTSLVKTIAAETRPRGIKRQNAVLQEARPLQEAVTAVISMPPVQRDKAPPAKKMKLGPTRDLETSLRAQGFQCVGGADEAGRGPLAGPVVAAVCVIPEDVEVDGLNDSKQLNEAQRDELFKALTEDARIKWAVHVIPHDEIDRLNILQAALLAMATAAAELAGAGSLDYLMVDGNRLPSRLSVPAQSVVKGDALCTCIAAASIIAKVTRDRLMMAYHSEYPQYGFDKHKGYGVPAHLAALVKHGHCAIHRLSFEPIKSRVGWSRVLAPAT